MRRFICLLLFFASMVLVHAADAIDNQIDQIKSLAQAENAGRATLDLLEDIGTSTNHAKYDEALQQTTELLKDPLPQDLKDALQKFSTALTQLRDKQTKERIAEAASLLSKVADACWKARKPADLTAVGAELSAFEIGSPANPGIPQGDTTTSSLDQFLSTWAQFLTTRQSGDVRNTLNELTNIQNNGSFTAVTSLFPKDGIAVLRTQIREEAAKNVAQEFDQLAADIAQAKSAHDLTIISAKLEGMRNQAESDVIGPAAAGRFSRDQNALNSWVAVITAEEAGDVNQALKSFSDFLSEPGDIIPPTVIAAKRSALFLESVNHPSYKLTPASIETFAQKLDAVKNPDELDELIRGLESLHQAGFQSNEIDLLPLQVDLSSLVKQWRYLNDSRFDGFWNFDSDLTNHPWISKTTTMRKDLAVRTLNQQFGAKLDSTSIHSIPEAFDALLKQTTAQDDWAKTEQILLIQSRYFISTGGNTDLQTETLKAVSDYVEGSNLEQAGQWTDAIVSYRQVVRHKGAYVPRQQALDHLKKIIQEHPEAVPKP